MVVILIHGRVSVEQQHICRRGARLKLETLNGKPRQVANKAILGNEQRHTAARVRSVGERREMIRTTGPKGMPQGSFSLARQRRQSQRTNLVWD